MRRRWNIREEKCVHELFEEQVERSPGAVAVVFEEQMLSYGELNRRANRLGHYLRELGVGADERVAICVERGLEMVVAVLGVLKAGGSVCAAGSGVSGSAPGVHDRRQRGEGCGVKGRRCSAHQRSAHERGRDQGESG